MRRVHRSLVLTASSLAVLSLVLGALFAVRLTPAHAATSATYTATKGLLTAVGTSNPALAPAAAPAAPVAGAPTKGARVRHPGANTAAQARQSGPALSGAASTLNAPPAGALLQNFDGVSSLDSEQANFGAEFEPPDQGLCAGNGFVLEAVNSAFRIYRPDGTTVSGPFNVNVLYDEGLKQFTSDPRCHYDAPTHTWFATVLFISSIGNKGIFLTNKSHEDLAVNTSGDPTTPWTVYQIDTTDDGSAGMPNDPGCPCFGDQPRLGLDANNIYISTDEFSILGPQLNGTQIYAISKADLINHAPHIHIVHYGNLSDGGILAFGVQPAITLGSADAEYFLNALDPNGTTDNRLGVWALTDSAAVSNGGVPILSNVVIGSETYGVPPNAVQQGSSSLINTGDDRMQQVEFINGQLWGALDTALTIPGDTEVRSAAAWFTVQPHLAGPVIGSATVAAQGYVASTGNYLSYPAIAVTGNGTAALVMTLSGATFFPSAVYTVMRSGHGSFGSLNLAAAGTGPYDPNATRWGDYSWAIPDPSGNGIWFATEYVPPLSSQTPDRARNWGTRVFEVSASK